MKELGFETKAVRLQSQRTHQKEHSVPLYLTSSFTFDDAAEGAAIFAGEAEGNLYSRFSNPNTDEFAAEVGLSATGSAGPFRSNL